MIRHNAAINVTTYYATVSECVFQLLVNTTPYYNNLLFECASSKIRLITAIFYKSPLPNTENMINQRQDTGKPATRRGRKALGTHRVSQLQTPAEASVLSYQTLL